MYKMTSFYFATNYVNRIGAGKNIFIEFVFPLNLSESIVSIIQIIQIEFLDCSNLYVPLIMDMLRVYVLHI